MTPAVHLLVFEGFADWEPAYALAEVRRSGGLEVVTMGFTPVPVRSMGGIRVVPDQVLAAVESARVRLLLLPGGDLWEGEDYPREPLETLLHRLERDEVPIAAICGATLATARAGLLEDRAHTSNDLAYLQRIPSYGGSSRYVDALAVRDRGLITASGLGPTEFAREIFEELGVFSPEDRRLWYHVFKYGRLPEPSGQPG
jgi:putative intracellular protease/amidase